MPFTRHGEFLSEVTRVSLPVIYRMPKALCLKACFIYSVQGSGPVGADPYHEFRGIIFPKCAHAGLASFLQIQPSATLYNRIIPKFTWLFTDTIICRIQPCI